MDGEYEETRKVQSGENPPNFMVHLINSFLSVSHNSMRDLAGLLEARNVDFTKVTIAAHLIKGGGNRVLMQPTFMLGEPLINKSKSLIRKSPHSSSNIE